MIGGYAGGEEGAAVMAVAQVLLCNVTLMGEVVEATVTDIRTMGNSTPSALRANSVAIQAIAHNTKIKYSCDNTGNLDTCTDPFLYEVANIQMVTTASGVSESHGPRTGGGRYPEHSTPVEATLMGEVAERAASMKREDANELAFRILEKYQGSLKYPPKGKSWREVIDPRTLKPIKEWTDLYNKVRKDLIDIGLFTE
jgi:hypothetical protein